MAQVPIKRMLHNGERFFPVEALDAVFDTDGKTLRTLLNDMKTLDAQRTPIGTIGLFPVNVSGKGGYENWLFCDGSALSRTTYAALFAVIGTTFGAGNGSTTFNIPNYQGVFPRFYGERTIANGIKESNESGSTTYAAPVFGQLQFDAIRNISGTIEAAQWGTTLEAGTSGAFKRDALTSNQNISYNWSGDYRFWRHKFHAGYIVPTTTENRPISMSLYPCIRVM
jgi:microcystin-dependent protein